MSSKQPTHEDWQRARDKRERAALKAVRALLDGKTDTAMQHALESDAQDDLMWSISRILDGDGSDLPDSDVILGTLEAAGVDKADQFDALTSVQKLLP